MLREQQAVNQHVTRHATPSKRELQGCAQNGKKRSGIPDRRHIVSISVLLCLFFLEVSLQELLLNITRYWLIVSEVHSECSTT